MTYEYRIEYKGPERTEGGIPDKARIDVKETYRATDVVGIACTVRLYVGEERMARVTIAWGMRKNSSSFTATFSNVPRRAARRNDGHWEVAVTLTELKEKVFRYEVIRLLEYFGQPAYYTVLSRTGGQPK